MACTLVETLNGTALLREKEVTDMDPTKWEIVLDVDGALPETFTRIVFTHRGTTYTVKTGCANNSEDILQFIHQPVGWGELLGCGNAVGEVISFFDCTHDVCCGPYGDEAVTEITDPSADLSIVNFEYGVGEEDRLTPDMYSQS